MTGKYSGNHPQTSVDAARSITAEALGRKQLEVLEAIETLGDATMDEIASHLDLFPWRQSISARLNELHHDYRLIEVAGTRPGLSGRQQQAYRIVRPGQQEMTL